MRPFPLILSALLIIFGGGCARRDATANAPSDPIASPIGGPGPISSSPSVPVSVPIPVTEAVPASTGEDVVYQYAVPATDGSGKPITAYLWVPPLADRIRGVVVGGTVLFEGSFAAHPAIRAACAEQRLAIVHFQPHLDAMFDVAKGAGDRLQKALDDLGEASGFRELAVAPLMPYGHSVATVFTRNVLFWKPQRCFSALIFKGGFGVPAGRRAEEVAGIPILQVQGQFEEFGPGPDGGLRTNEDRETGWKTAVKNLLDLRGRDQRLLMSLLVDAGSTHYPLHDAVAVRIAAFIRAAAIRRIPDWPPEASESPALTAIDPASGALSGGAPFAPAAPAAPAAEYRGEASASFWHLDADLARGVEAFHAGKATRKPQFATFADAQGRPMEVGDDMRLKLAPTWIGPDTVRVKAVFRSTVPRKYPPVEGAVGHADGDVRIRSFAGPLIQIGPDTFRVTMDHRGGTRCFLLAYHPGDATYRACEQPAVLRVPAKLTKGKAQVITFADVPEMKADDLPIALTATSDSDLPVSFHVDAGPARVRDGRLELADVPATSIWPLEIDIVAWQYGSAVAPEVQSAEPVRRRVKIVE